jgi:hypothetical protein
MLQSGVQSPMLIFSDLCLLKTQFSDLPNILQNDFVPFSMSYGVNIDKGWFQQVDKMPHTAGTTRFN